MRHVKFAAFVTAFALLGTSLATGVSSTSTGYGSATMSLTASGQYASAVSFTVPATSLTIPTTQVRPGATFTVTVPVTNTTDRAITVQAGTVTAPSNVTVVATTGTLNLAAGEEGNLVYSITFADDTTGAHEYGGDAITFSFPINASDTPADEDNLEFGSSS